MKQLYQLRNIALSIFLLCEVTSCCDEYLPTSQDTPNFPKEVFEVSRMYDAYQLPITEEKGCYLVSKGDFFFLSDTTIQSGKEITLEYRYSARTGYWYTP